MEAIVLVGLALHLVVIVSLVVMLRRRAGASPRAVVRTASLNAPGTLRWWIALSCAVLPISAAAALLALRWDAIPPRFPIHWGFSGTPNAWAARSVGSVFGLPAAGVVGLLVMGVLGQATMRSSPGFAGREKLLGFVRNILLLAAWAVAVMDSALSLLPLSADPTAWIPAVMVVAMVSSLAILVYVAYRALTMGDVMAAAQASTDARFWKGGMFYINPGDSALFVPKRMGLGYTLNFGRPMAWVVMGALLALPLVSVVLAVKR